MSANGEQLPMQAFKTKPFARWASGAGLGDDALAFAVAEMERGLIDARLGGQVVKKRVALAGRGKRGATRTKELLAYSAAALIDAMEAGELFKLEV